MTDFIVKLSDLSGDTEEDLKLLQQASLEDLHRLVYEDFKENVGIINDYNFGTTKLDELKFLPFLFDKMKSFSQNKEKKLQIMDAGCGAGQVLIDLLECGCLEPEDDFLLVGLDVNAVRLAKDTKKNLHDHLKRTNREYVKLHNFVCEDQLLDFNMSSKDIVLISGDIMNVSCVPDNTFDIIITHRLFSYVFDVIQALGECIRMLRPGGNLFIPIEHIIKPGLPGHYLEMNMDNETEKKYLINQLLEKKSKITYDQLKKDFKVDRYEALNYFKHKFKWCARIGLAESSDYIKVEKISLESPKDDDLPHFIAPVWGSDVEFVLYRKEIGQHFE